MYNSESARLPVQTVSLNSPVPPMYDFSGYHPVPGVGEPSTNVWNPIFSPRDEYPYTYTGSSPGTGHFSFSSPDLSGTPPANGGGSFTPYNFVSGQDPDFSRSKPLEPTGPSVSGGKTRTKEKYRVVYTDRQRLELEKEFQYNRYITMRKKTELSSALGLSERQVKIWFQNRRAKERKESRRKLQQSQQASTTSPTPPVLGGATDGHVATSPSSNILLDTITEDY